MATKNININWKYFFADLPDNIFREDVNKAKEVLLEGKYERGTGIDPFFIETVVIYLSHFSGEVFNVKEILNETTVRSIIGKDERLSLIRDPENLIPESFYKVSTFMQLNNLR